LRIPGHLAQDSIAGTMTPTVVDVFEMIDVQHDGGEGALIPDRALDFALAELRQTPAVMDTGQLVGALQALHIVDDATLHFQKV
jgi:hypothetical protein